ncbi:hypothetical protein Pmar_PMAR018132 [Perkinsus marinus ATCC 50983]|uniref:Uncharacterized protein n=1 Tax=Perkinsus marinus (strain ATCC 50983 / TXsc) TaxID=423536 RepID=C5LEA8_PERM5|nr:hypothetical protein Pmar_PMAR018132 [Perkinsus marinus ATCC 50983]EER04935.1 hypothetical protein Pmar_PMAR018132 [Perkinsus marinus ATCC 50983]|eukprot:XP_002773119.1 hypothetical protein Pmar_PMAR018132 [Perkinsus marinus ATCC 50983]
MFPEEDLVKQVRFNQLEQSYEDDDDSDDISMSIQVRAVSWTKVSLRTGYDP